MTINSTIAASGPFVGTGVAQRLPFGFHAASADEVEVEVNGVTTNAYTVQLEDDRTGSVLGTFPAGSTIYVASAPSFQQDTDFNRFAPYFPDAINSPLDRAAIRDIALLDKVKRAPQIPRDGSANGRFSAVNAAGEWYFPDASPVGDSGLRTDLASGTGAANIGDTLPIIGAVPLSQARINALTVDVVRCGADPTGFADSTAAFNLATGAAQTHVGNETPLKRLIRVPAGKYRIDGKVYVRRGQQLQGDGLASTWIDFTQAGAQGGFVLGCGNTGAVDPGGLGVVVAGLFFYGEARPAIDTSKPDSWNVLDCMFTETGNAIKAGGTDGHVSRCIFDGGDTGIDIYSGHSIRVHGNLFFNTNTDMRVYANACDVLISGNVHQYPEIASLQLMSGATGIRNLIFSNNLCMMNGQFESHIGFVFINSTGADVQIKGNSFRNGRGYALAYGGGLGNRVVFAENDVDGLKTTAVYDQSLTASGVEVSNMEAIVEGNRFFNLPGTPIRCAPTAATSVQVKGNTFKRNTGGTTDIQIVGANASSAILLDQSNFSDRDIVPPQTGVSVFAPRVATGRATLVGGQVVIALPITRTSSRVLVQRYQDGGTVAGSYSVSRSPGTGFTILAKDGNGANQSADTSIVDWSLDLMGV